MTVPYDPKLAAFKQRTLYTKDGSKTGNAFLVRELSDKEVDKLAPVLLSYLKNTDQKLYWIETDFGNHTNLSTNEVNEQFTYGPEQNYDEWRKARQNLIDGDDEDY